MVDLGVERDFVPLASGPSAAGAAAVVNVPARAGCRVQLGFIHFSYTAAPAGGRLTISVGASNEFDNDITTGGFQPVNIPGDGLTFEPGQAVVVTLAGGGGAIVGKISLAYRYIRHR